MYLKLVLRDSLEVRKTTKRKSQVTGVHLSWLKAEENKKEKSYCSWLQNYIERKPSNIFFAMKKKKKKERKSRGEKMLPYSSENLLQREKVPEIFYKRICFITKSSNKQKKEKKKKRKEKKPFPQKLSIQYRERQLYKTEKVSFFLIKKDICI